MFPVDVVRTTITVAAAAALLAGCGMPSPIPHTPPTAAMTEAVHDAPQRTFTPASPGSGDGTWPVPSQIRPGTYRADQTGVVAGYVATCADLRCDIDMDGDDSTGLIDNWTISGPTYVVIPSYAVAVRTDRCRLTPLDAAPPPSPVAR